MERFTETELIESLQTAQIVSQKSDANYLSNLLHLVNSKELFLVSESLNGKENSLK